MTCKKRFSPNIGYQTRSASTQERLFPRNRYCEHVASFLCTQAVLFATFAVAECKCRVARTRAENARTQSIFLRVSNAHSLRLCANVFCFHLCIIAVLTRLVELTTSLPAPPCGRSAPYPAGHGTDSPIIFLSGFTCLTLLGKAGNGQPLCRNIWLNKEVSTVVRKA